MPDTKAVTDIKRLEEQLAGARETAKNGFLASISESVEQLRAIGFQYELVAKNGTATPNGKTCSKCGNPGHNARGCPQPK